jgi:quercetin dioxygenase-like cupin family protein
VRELYRHPLRGFVPPRVANRPTSPWSRYSPGVRVRHLIDGEGTALHLYQIEPGTRVAIHAHEFPELGMVLSGTGMILLDDEERVTQAGDSFYLPGGLRHGFQVPSGGVPVLMINVEATPPPAQHLTQSGRPRAGEPAAGDLPMSSAG